VTGLDVLVAGGEVLTPDGLYPLDVGVAGGRIAGLYAPGQGPAAAEVIDAGGLTVMPGIVELLTALHDRAERRGDVVLGLLSGNYRQAAPVTSGLLDTVFKPGLGQGPQQRQRRLIGKPEGKPAIPVVKTHHIVTPAGQPPAQGLGPDDHLGTKAHHQQDGRVRGPAKGFIGKHLAVCSSIPDRLESLRLGGDRHETALLLTYQDRQTVMGFC